MSKSLLDQMVEVYAKHTRRYNPATVSQDELKSILYSVKRAVLSDLRDEYIRQLKKDAQAEARQYKKSLFKKVRTVIIIETMFVAFLVGIIVNQATFLLPESNSWAGGIIVVSLLLCVLLIALETGKD